MARVMPFRLEAMLRAAGRLLPHARSRSALERLKEQLQLESSKVASTVSRAELQDQLNRVLDAVAALANAQDIALDPRGTRSSPRPAEAWPLVAANRLFTQPPLAHGKSALRAVRQIAQRAGRGVRTPSLPPPLPSHSPLFGLPLPGPPALYELLQRRATLRQALTTRSEQLLTAPSATIALVRAEITASTQRLGLGRDGMFALLGSISSPAEDGGTLLGDLDLRAHAQLTPSYAPAAHPPPGADLELRLRVRGLSTALSARANPIAELFAARRSEIAIWIVSTTSRLLYEHVIRPHISSFLPQHPLLAAVLARRGQLSIAPRGVGSAATK